MHKPYNSLREYNAVGFSSLLQEYVRAVRYRPTGKLYCTDMIHVWEHPQDIGNYSRCADLQVNEEDENCLFEEVTAEDIINAGWTEYRIPRGYSFDMDDTVKACMDEINTFPQGSAPWLLQTEYKDFPPFGALDLLIGTVHGEYLIRFNSIAAYFTRREEYTEVDPIEIYTGRCIREFTKSHFLDVMKQMSFAHLIDPYRHYGAYTENTIFDIASFTAPQILKVSSKTNE